MRQIEFRGKTKKTGKWVYGDLVHNAFDSGKIIEVGIQSESCYPDEVIPETVGQFTGRLDKNNTTIWEGDICKTYNIGESPANLIDTVVFEDGSFLFKNDYKLSVELRGFKTDYIEVIGNIHDTVHESLSTQLLTKLD